MVIDRVAEFIRQYQMIAPGDVVLTGFSGGADSVLLLELLRELAKKDGFQVQAVHVHHNLRGEEADRDAAFAEAFCAERKIPFFLYSCPVEEVARKEHLSLEEAGRMERRRVFRECMEAHGGTRIALAHHRNDLAETMIHHLARGTSLAGLASLRPVRGNFIRPLLCLERTEIEKELERRKIVWCDDSTNQADDYTRNGIRHHVIPYLERQVNERSVAHMAETSLDLLEAEEYFCAEAEKLFRSCCVRREGGLELQERLAKEAKILQRYVVRDCLEQLAGQRKDLGREHLESVLDLFEKQVGKRVCLPYGLEAVRGYDGIVLRSSDGNVLRKEKSVPAAEKAEKAKNGKRTGGDGAEKNCNGIEIPGEGIYHWKEFQIRASFPQTESLEAGQSGQWQGANFKRISEKKYTKCFNYARIRDGLVLRTRRSGDFLTVRADGSRKKLKDYMIDAKIPREQRDSILLAADGQEIVWVVGYRISERYRVREDAEKIIQLEVSGGYTNE